MPWRKAVKKTMQQATEQEIIYRFGSLDNASFNYRWEHVQSVVALATRLGELTGADLEVVEAAAWLHDVRKDAGDSHPRQGAKFAREFLPQTTFPPEKIERVAQAIEDHMGLWRDKPLKNLESMVLWDADKLAKIGLTAVFHWTGLALAGNKSRALSDLIARGRSADWQAKTVASMHTKPARRAAKSRLKSYNKLWDSLEAELKGDDLLAKQ
ncbi:MAG: HD domain-containing protein [Chloroflexi bacterium]|nr:HD domain-containing protein [Chloroflexota bacterium]MBP7043659.1 HD domain-containing protein [Chloroflexota bacterium]